MAWKRFAPDARVISVIEVIYRRGQGVEHDPVRMVTAYYSFEGELLAERDDWETTATVESGRTA